MSTGSTADPTTINSDLPFSERLYFYLQTNQDKCDVNFIVGSNQTPVKASSLILEAASPSFQKLFHEKWSKAVTVGEGEGISLPDFDADTFKLFLRLLPSEFITEEVLQKLSVTTDQILILLELSKTFSVERMHTDLEFITKSFFENFHDFIETLQFLSLPVKTLQTVLSSDFIPMKETDIFKGACEWAKYQCGFKLVQLTPENMRAMLGDVFSEIRFPLMTMSELSKIVFPTKLLTHKEKSYLFEYMALDEIEKRSLDESQLEFKVKKRTPVPVVAGNWSHLRLFTDSQISSDDPFECNWSTQSANLLRVQQNIELVGVGFLGPAGLDGDYEVEVEPQLWGESNWISCGQMQKRIHAEQRQIFYFIFEEPILVSPQEGSSLFNLRIFYKLEGPPTQSLGVDFGVSECFEFDAAQDGVNLHCQWHNRQLAVLLFNPL